MTEFLSVLFRVNIALGAVLLVILAVRLPMRKMVGPGAAYALWAITPLAALVALAPAPSAPAMQVMTETVAPITQAVTAVEAAVAASPTDAQAPFPWTFALWAAGATAMAAWIAAHQWGFLRRARLGLAGPAVAGVLFPRIITPADFDRRFSEEERSMILAHERVHLSRQDARLNAFVAVVQCLCWFNPLVHLAAYFMRLDQELSCDAAVMRRHPGSSRAYAEAMLKTQGAGELLPLGCAWPSRGESPLEKRIGLLRRPPPSLGRKLIAAVAAVGLALGSAAGARALQPAEQVAAIDTGAAFVLGREDAPVRLVEYGSPTCPLCAKPFLEVLPQLKSRYIDTGQLRYEYREIATGPQDVALAALLTARSAGRDAYPAVMSDIYRRQMEMMSAADPLAVLRDIAAAHGVGERQFNARVLDPAGVAEMKAIVDDNLKGRVNGAPYYAFSSPDHPGYAMRYMGLQSLEQMDALIAAARRGEVRQGQGLQTSAYEAPSRALLPQTQIDALMAEMRESGFAPPQARGPSPDQDGVSIHGALLRGGRRQEFGLTGAAHEVNIVPMSTDAAVALAVTIRGDMVTLRTLVAVEDRPIVRGPVVSARAGERVSMSLPGGEILELRVRADEPAPVRLAL